MLRRHHTSGFNHIRGGVKMLAEIADGRSGSHLDLETLERLFNTLNFHGTQVSGILVLTALLIEL